MEREARFRKIHQVLWRTFFLNLAVSIVKIVLGTLTGLLAITADGLHSLGDSLVNVAGIFAIFLARKEPDEKYSYGYDKFETVATLIIAAIISITFFEVLKAGVVKLIHPHPEIIAPYVIYLMAITAVINSFIVWYEGRAGKRLKSMLLIADAAETKSDIFISLAIIVGVYLIRLTGTAWIDGAITVLVALLILRIIVKIISSTSAILCDAQVVSPEEIVRVAVCVPGVKFCHAVRTRGREDGFYADLHLGVDGSLSVIKAHDEICHEVKKALREKFPGMKSANIHIEPDNEESRKRARSVFSQSDPYDI